MQFIMFTKHLEGFDLPQIVAGIKSVGLDGADLCVRPGYPITPENSDQMLKKAVQMFADEGLSVPLVTTPGNFTDPKAADAERLYAACGEAGVRLLKLGYWVMKPDEDYWKKADGVLKALKGFAKLSRKYGVKSLVHTHSGPYMGLNVSAGLQLVGEFEPEEVGLFLDAGHLTMCGEPMFMAISMGGKYVSCFAFKDLVRLPGSWGGREVYYPHTRRLGWGAVDWDEVVKSIIDAGLQDLPISLHSEYGGIPAESVLDIARVDLRFIKQKFQEVGGK